MAVILGICKNKTKKGVRVCAGAVNIIFKCYTGHTDMYIIFGSPPDTKKEKANQQAIKRQKIVDGNDDKGWKSDRCEGNRTLKSR